MAIIIDDKILAAANMSEKDLLIEIAFLLYEKKIFGLGKAREFCGLSIVEFEKEMSNRNISRFSEESLRQDIETMNQLFPK
jgi:predicted HTH domain antitoxin